MKGWIDFRKQRKYTFKDRCCFHINYLNIKIFEVVLSVFEFSKHPLYSTNKKYRFWLVLDAIINIWRLVPTFFPNNVFQIPNIKHNSEST